MTGIDLARKKSIVSPIDLAKSEHKYTNSGMAATSAEGTTYSIFYYSLQSIATSFSRPLISRPRVSVSPSPFYHSCWRNGHLYLDAAQGPLPRGPEGLANCYNYRLHLCTLFSSTQILRLNDADFVISNFPWAINDTYNNKILQISGLHCCIVYEIV